MHTAHVPLEASNTNVTMDKFLIFQVIAAVYLMGMLDEESEQVGKDLISFPT